MLKCTSAGWMLLALLALPPAVLPRWPGRPARHACHTPLLLHCLHNTSHHPCTQPLTPNRPIPPPAAPQLPARRLLHRQGGVGQGLHRAAGPDGAPHARARRRGARGHGLLRHRGGPGGGAWAWLGAGAAVSCALLSCCRCRCRCHCSCSCSCSCPAPAPCSRCWAERPPGLAPVRWHWRQVAGACRHPLTPAPLPLSPCARAQVKQEAAQRHLGLRFHGAKDHLDASMHEYQVGGWGRLRG